MTPELASHNLSRDHAPHLPVRKKVIDALLSTDPLMAHPMLAHPHRDQPQDTPYRLGAAGARLIRRDPQVEQFEIVGLKADRERQAFTGWQRPPLP